MLADSEPACPTSSTIKDICRLHRQLTGLLCAFTGAQQFREQFENAMSQNETLLALDDAEANSKDANPTEVSDLADQVGKVSVSDTPNGNGAASEAEKPAAATSAH